MPISKSALARHWGLARQTVMERVKQGCPLNSIRAADHWLEHRKLKRAPTTGPNVCKFAVGETEPLEPIDGVKRRGRPGTPNQPSRSSDSLRDALDNAITVQERAFIQVDKAIINGASSMSALLHFHTKALEARFMAEKAYREEMERRGLLIDKQKVTDLCRRAMDAVLRRLKKLPGERGPECNPENAIMAVGILTAEVNSIIATGKKAFDTLEF